MVNDTDMNCNKKLYVQSYWISTLCRMCNPTCLHLPEKCAVVNSLSCNKVWSFINDLIDAVQVILKLSVSMKKSKDSNSLFQQCFKLPGEINESYISQKNALYYLSPLFKLAKALFIHQLYLCSQQLLHIISACSSSYIWNLTF